VVSEEWALASKFAPSVISLSDGVNTNEVFGWLLPWFSGMYAVEFNAEGVG
jgi:hypothetical protein